MRHQFRDLKPLKIRWERESRFNCRRPAPIPAALPTSLGDLRGVAPGEAYREAHQEMKWSLTAIATV